MTCVVRDAVESDQASINHDNTDSTGPPDRDCDLDQVYTVCKIDIQIMVLPSDRVMQAKVRIDALMFSVVLEPSLGIGIEHIAFLSKGWVVFAGSISWDRRSAGNILNRAGKRCNLIKHRPILHTYNVKVVWMENLCFFCLSGRLGIQTEDPRSGVNPTLLGRHFIHKSLS